MLLIEVVQFVLRYVHTYLTSCGRFIRAYLVVGSSERLCRPQHKVAFLGVEPDKSRETTLCGMGRMEGVGYNGVGREEREGYGWRCDGIGREGQGELAVGMFVHLG